MSSGKRTITYVRHAQQTTHRTLDPDIKAAPPPLEGVPYDRILTSPYLRCRRTAQALNEFNKRVTVDLRISEYNGHKAPKKNAQMNPTSPGPIPPLDESWDDFAARVDRHWSHVKTLEGDILVVTHGIVVNYMHEKIFGSKLYSRGRDIPFVTGFKVEI